jgi:ferritin
MLSKKMEKALNDQVNAEMFAGYLYQSISAYYNSIDLPGFANWYYVQAREEFTHALRIYNYMFERGGTVKLLALKAPKTTWKDPSGPLKDVLAHEEMVTGLINKLVDMAQKEKDHATINFLQWFVEEQVEEEENAHNNINRMKLAGKAGQGLFMLDKEMGARVLSPRATTFIATGQLPSA